MDKEPSKTSTSVIKDSAETQQSISEIFDNMDYGENYENLDEGLKWIKSKQSSFFSYIEDKNEDVNGTPIQIKSSVNPEEEFTIYTPDTATITKLMSKVAKKTKWINTDVSQRSKIINKLAVEIEKSVDVLSQIEIVFRGILGKDTKNKAIPLLAQYFYYYSDFSQCYAQENPSWQPKGLAVGVIANENILSNVGLMLAPALAAGYNVVLQVGTTLFPAVSYIAELAYKVGIPEECLRLVPSDSGNLTSYLACENVIILTLLVDLNNEYYKGVNNINKKILNLSCDKTPVIVFDNADLDSACVSIVDSAWGYLGLLPWSVDTVIVQENIFDQFVSKLKTQLRGTRVGLANNKMVDVSCPNEATIIKIKEVVTSAISQGVDVYRFNEEPNAFSPTLLIGNKVDTNRVISSNKDLQMSVVTVLAFRSIDEAVALANNSRQGLAASVWTENIGTANEVSIKLRVNNVWINSHGLSAVEIPLCPIKNSGVGYFGGSEGFSEYVLAQKIPEGPFPTDFTGHSSCPYSAIKGAKKCQETWWRMSKLNKAKLFRNFALYIDSNKVSLSSSLEETWVNYWITDIYQCITQRSYNYSSMYSDFNVVSTGEPLGVVVIENDVKSEIKNIKLILGALFEGNTVILLTNSSRSLPFYNVLRGLLPTSVFNVLSYNGDNLEVISKHKEINAYFGRGLNPVYSLLPVRETRVYKTVPDKINWKNVVQMVTFTKNVWSNVGKSSNCKITTY